MNDPHAVNRSINNIMNKYITEQGYQDSVLFESKVMIHSTSIMFTMMMKQGLLKVEPFKAVFPIGFLSQCDEDSVVNMICGMFKAILEQCHKLEVDNEKSEDERLGKRMENK